VARVEERRTWEGRITRTSGEALVTGPVAGLDLGEDPAVARAMALQGHRKGRTVSSPILHLASGTTKGGC
jgi:hypothetical protein